MKKYICRKKVFIVVLIGCLFLILNINVFSQSNDQEDRIICHATIDDNFSENEILVVLNKENSKIIRKYESYDFSEINCISVQDLTSSYDTEYEMSNNFRRILKLTIKDNSKSKVLESIKVLERRNDLVSAEPNYYDSCDAAPNDSALQSQYAVDRIDLPRVWDFSTGSRNVTVGVIDTGIDANHLDLKDRIDRDLSHNFSNDFTTALEDATGHGTHIAGIIGATGNNGIGITGIAWNVSLVSLRVANSSGNFPIDNVIKAISYANDMGINILNYSGGGYNTGESVTAREQAISNYKGLFVCGAGNDNKNTDIYKFYPASHDLPNLISVGATNNLDARWSFGPGESQGSNFGERTVDLYAPGESIYSTLPGQRYGYQSGTSMATPHVVGVAALLLSIHPSLTASQIKSAILNGADGITISISSSNNSSVQTVKRVNAYGALKYIFSNYSLDSYSLDYGTLKIDKSINSNSSYFVEKNAMIKLTKDNYQYGFTITSTAKMEVIVLDGNFNEVSISKTIMNDGCKIFFDPVLASGVYYLKVNYTSPTTSGQIKINIHAHTYEDHYCTICDSYTDSHYFHDPYTWLNTKQHRATCGCSATTKQGHAVLKNDYASGKSVVLCFLCGGRADIGFVTEIGLLSLGESRRVTKNGSFILPNGVIVLVEEDVEAYIMDSLVFYEENNLNLVVDYNFI